jgi:hypothetical protein
VRSDSSTYSFQPHHHFRPRCYPKQYHLGCYRPVAQWKRLSKTQWLHRTSPQQTARKIHIIGHTGSCQATGCRSSLFLATAYQTTADAWLIQLRHICVDSFLAEEFTNPNSTFFWHPVSSVRLITASKNFEVFHFSTLTCRCVLVVLLLDHYIPNCGQIKKCEGWYSYRRSASVFRGLKGLWIFSALRRL